MKNTLEKLWNEYFAEECAAMDTAEEKALIKKAGELHKIANESLSREQKDATENYIEALYEMQDCFGKKAFFKGCEFATSFLLEAGNIEKA